jgi:hypothetical protein
LHKKHCGPHILSLFGQPTTAEKKCHSRRTKTLSKAQPFDCTLKTLSEESAFQKTDYFIVRSVQTPHCFRLTAMSALQTNWASFAPYVILTQRPLQ